MLKVAGYFWGSSKWLILQIQNNEEVQDNKRKAAAKAAGGIQNRDAVNHSRCIYLFNESRPCVGAGILTLAFLSELRICWLGGLLVFTSTLLWKCWNYSDRCYAEFTSRALCFRALICRVWLGRANREGCRIAGIWHYHGIMPGRD